MIGRMYYRTRDPEQIKRMTLSEMKYWDTWNLAIDKGYKEAFQAKK